MMINSGKEKIRLKDIAEILDCSISTVSKSLKNSPEISDAVKKKVKDVAKTYRYSTNFFAKNLRNNNAKVISVSKSNKDDLRFLKKLFSISELTLVDKFALRGFEGIKISPKDILKDDSVDIFLVISEKDRRAQNSNRTDTIKSEK